MVKEVHKSSVDGDERLRQKSMASAVAATEEGESKPSMAPSIKAPIFGWVTDPMEIAAGSVDVGEIDPFHARGMRRVYSRGDHFGGGQTFQLDIWKNKHDQLFMRCWSSNSDCIPRSFLITGVNPQGMVNPDGKPDLREESIPQIVRNAYDDWFREEF